MRLLLTALCALCAVPFAAAADGVSDKLATQTAFNMPAQPLGLSLKQLADQAGIQILFEERLVTGLQAPAIKATQTAQQVLHTLLSDTGLEYTAKDETVAVRKKAPASARDQTTRNSPTANASDGDASLRVAQNNSSTDAGGASSDRQNTPDKTNSASSPTGEEGTSKLEEIIVTAQKREERLVDVPISIVALSADELQKRKIANVDDLSFAVPGLAIQSSGVQRRITLRGISNAVGNSSLIGLYLDEASVTSARSDLQLDLRTYDLERVEVLRGPQGTLFGEGSVGGTIRFITKNPQLNQFGMNMDTAALFTQGGAPGQRIEGMINVPVIERELGLRIAGTFDHAGGWMDQPAAGKKDFNEQNLANVRIKGLWQPAPSLTVSAMAVIHRNDGSPSIGEDESGNYTQVFNLTTTPSRQDDYDIYNLTLAYDLAAARILSTTSYINQDLEARNYAFKLPFAAPPARPFDVLEPFYAQSRNTRSEELRLTSIGAGPWHWTLGGFYQRARIDNNFPAIHFGLPGAPGAPLPAPVSSKNSDSSESWATFADTSYEFAQRLTLGTGLRYFEDRRELAIVAPAASVQRGTFHAISPRAYAQYRLSGQANVYASAGRGFRSGGFNQLNQPRFDPERVSTYELGMKMSLPDRHLSADAAVFYSDYVNYQIVGVLPPPAPPFGIISNAGNASIKGVEWSLNWSPVDQWSLSLDGNYVRSRFYEINASSSSHAVGDSLDFFPKYTYTASVQRDFKWSSRSGFARLDYSGRDRMTIRNRRAGPWYFNESDVIGMLNFNMGLQWNESLSWSFFAQNLLDDRGFTDPLSIQAGAARSRPRTFGIGLGLAL